MTSLDKFRATRREAGGDYIYERGAMLWVIRPEAGRYVWRLGPRFGEAASLAEAESDLFADLLSLRQGRPPMRSRR